MLSCLAATLIPCRGITYKDGAQQPVPKGEKGLRKVGLDTPALVVYVVVAGIVARDVLQRIPGQRVATVIIDGLEGRADKEVQALARRHACNFIRQTCADRVE